MTDANSKISTITYNLVGKALTSTDPLERTTTFTYYKNGMPKTVTTPGSNGGGATTTFHYDENDNRTKVVDPMGRATSYTYDEGDRMATVTDANGKVSAYTYQNGKLAATQDPRGFITTMSYDGNDRMVERANAITTESFSYDPLGNIEQKTTPLGHINYGFDELNRVVSVSMPESDRTVNYTFDNNSNRTGATIHDSSGPWTISNSYMGYDYDADDRLTFKTKKIEGQTVEQLSLEYDNNNNLTTLQVTAKRAGIPLSHASTPPADLNFSVNYVYDDLDRQTSVTNSSGDTFTATYDDVGNMTKIIYPGGIRLSKSTSTRVFDDENRISRVTNHYLNSDAIVTNIHYTYKHDKVGNCKSVTIDPVITGSAGTKLYEYDNLNRLISDQNAMMSYEYDDAGNKTKDILLAGTTVQETVPYTYNSAHQLLKIETDKLPDSNYSYHDLAKWIYQYDGNGNMSRKTLYVPDSYVYYDYNYNVNTYNVMNRLVSTKGYSVHVDKILGANVHDEIFEYETRQYFDDNDDPIFRQERWKSGDDFGNEHTDWNTSNGYLNGLWLYCSLAREDRYYYGIYNNRFTTYYTEYYTYLNGVKVGQISMDEGQATSSGASLLDTAKDSDRDAVYMKLLKRSGYHSMRLENPAPSTRAATSTSRSPNQSDYILMYDGQENLTESTGIRGFATGTARGSYTSYGEGGSYNSGTNGGHFKGYNPGLYGYQTGIRNYDPQTGRFLQPDPFKGYMSEPASQNPYMYCKGNPIKYSDPSGYDVYLNVSSDIGSDTMINWDKVGKAISTASGQPVHIGQFRHPEGKYREHGKTQNYVTIKTSTSNFGSFGSASGGNYGIELHQSFSNDNARATALYGAQSDENLSNLATNKIIHEFWHALFGPDHPQSWAEDNPVHPHPHEVWTNRTLDYHKWHADKIRKECK